MHGSQVTVKKKKEFSSTINLQDWYPPGGGGWEETFQREFEEMSPTFRYKVSFLPELIPFECYNTTEPYRYQPNNNN